MCDKPLPNKCGLLYSTETNKLEFTCGCPEDRLLCVYGVSDPILRWNKCKYCSDAGKLLSNCTSELAKANTIYRFNEMIGLK